MDARTLGVYGESLAAAYYRKQGFDIVAANYRTRMGEVDLIVASRKLLVFVEVKTRSTLIYGNPSEAVNIYKQNKIRKVAEQFLLENKLDGFHCRFDVIEIVGDKINHIENAF